MRKLRPCESELGYCCFVEHWAGCWSKGHEPNDRDESKCPQTPAEVDALYEVVVDKIIARSRRAARRTAGSSRKADGRV